MGPIGATFGTSAGALGGRWLANKFLGKDYANDEAAAGAVIGGAIGLGAEPFKTGGKVKGKKGKPRIIVAHSGEWILPVGVSPTKSQKSAIEKRKRISRQKAPQIFV